MQIDDEWKVFLLNQNVSHDKNKTDSNKNTNIEKNVNIEKNTKIKTKDIPKCEDLYISTKTKVLFLNQNIDINTIFWKIPIVEYWTPQPGVIKKQMKFVSKDQSEYQEIRKKLENNYYFTENIIKQIDNPNARRNKFKDERKITIGMSKKDVINSRGKVKNAFYNCFAIILRFNYENCFREIHVKVFNTGKLEIPGILNTNLLNIVKQMVLDTISPFVDIDNKLKFIENDREENVLINSNFNCGYYINREKLHSILRSEKYGIESAFDPCSYPGIKCKFYFNNELGFDSQYQNGSIIESDRSLKMNELSENKKYTEISFMIFRTGSCLIVGNCTEKILKFVFEFLKNILTNEYENINVKNDDQVVKLKKQKLRKKVISITNQFYTNNIIHMQREEKTP